MDIHIRCSQLATWMQCEGQAMSYLDDLELPDDAGPAAHTGTAAGRAVELLHLARLDGVRDDFEQIMERVKGESTTAARPFAKARWREVQNAFLGYLQDDRNSGVVYPEVPFTYSMTIGQDKVYLQGTVDQVRVTDSNIELWDLKLSVRDGDDLVKSYWPQLFAYTLGLDECRFTEYTQKVEGKAHVLPVKLGGIIRLTDYIKPLPRAGQKVFYPIRYSMRSVKAALSRLLHRVAEVQKGDSKPTLRPGIHCSWCPHKSHEVCVYLV